MRQIVLRDRTQPQQAPELLRQARQELKQRNWQLTQVLEIGNSMRLNVNQDLLLKEIVQGVHRSLGFQAVLLNLVDRNSWQVRAVAHVGLDGNARQILENAVYPWEEIAGLMKEEFLEGRCYFIPHGSFKWERDFRGPVCKAISDVPEPEDAGADSWHPDDALLVPIELRQGQIVGVMSVDQPADGRRPTQETLHGLEVFANLAAIAIENAQLREQIQDATAERAQAQASLRKLSAEIEDQVLERTAELTKMNTELTAEVEERRQMELELLQRNRELLSLQAAAVATASSLDLPFVLDTVTWEMAGLLEVESCAVSVWDQKANTLSVVAQYGPPIQRADGSAINVFDLTHYPLRSQVLAERWMQQVTANQPDGDPAELAYMQAADLKNLVILPMVFQDRVVGLVEISSRRAERSFADHELSLAQLLSNQAASAIQNAQLYERAQREIAERLRAEEQIRASLQEKELLLKEIHHRVKNNLQVISSLLNLQSKSIEEPSSLEMFKESQNRIRSMALIHEKLYRSDDLVRIDFGEYVRNLAAFLVRSYRSSAGPVSLKVDVRDVALGIDSAVPFGLIINELVSNALKHAFPPDSLDGKQGEICAQLHSDSDCVTLIIRDNGVGVPKDFEFQHTESLGMQLVNTLVNQLDGDIELNSNGGTEFKITFPTS
jgi:two-component sensor histidine kinase